MKEIRSIIYKMFMLSQSHLLKFFGHSLIGTSSWQFFLSNSEFSKQAYNFTDHRESVFDLMFYLSSTKTHSIQTKLPLSAYCVETRSQYHHQHKLSTSDPTLFLYFIPNVRTPTVAFLNIPHAHICAKDQLLLYI